MPLGFGLSDITPSGGQTLERMKPGRSKQETEQRVRFMVADEPVFLRILVEGGGEKAWPESRPSKGAQTEDK